MLKNGGPLHHVFQKDGSKPRHLLSMLPYAVCRANSNCHLEVSELLQLILG